jgi:hypothetical protein
VQSSRQGRVHVWDTLVRETTINNQLLRYTSCRPRLALQSYRQTSHFWLVSGLSDADQSAWLSRSYNVSSLTGLLQRSQPLQDDKYYYPMPLLTISASSIISGISIKQRVGKQLQSVLLIVFIDIDLRCYRLRRC